MLHFTLPELQKYFCKIQLYEHANVSEKLYLEEKHHYLWDDSYIYLGTLQCGPAPLWLIKERPLNCLLLCMFTIKRTWLLLGCVKKGFCKKKHHFNAIFRHKQQTCETFRQCWGAEQVKRAALIFKTIENRALLWLFFFKLSHPPSSFNSSRSFNNPMKTALGGKHHEYSSCHFI